ncbi:ATP-binding protein [Streptomyces daliensis]|uniref:ATP-binding protein n=1 Tax=Streptomyces daliensis TaxID=299421 RepID=A0A8T4IJB7_9ACTN|nr:ATP-binding protein [Streptomyces daliensis]
MTAPRPNMTGSPGYAQTMPCEPDSSGRARHLVDTALNTWSLGHLIEDAVLVTGELVSNAVRHSGSSVIVVTVSLPTPERVRVSVSDSSIDPPALRVTGREEESGRGLILVHEVADCWGSEFQHAGKVVWAELLIGECA